MHPIALHFLGPEIVPGGRFAEEEVVHPAKASHGIVEAHCNARSQHRGQHDLRFGNDAMFALDDGDAAHGVQDSAPKTRSIFSLRAAGVKGFTT